MPDFTATNTGTSLSAMAPDSVRKLWHKGVLVGEQTEDFFAQLEGDRKDSPIRTITDTSKGAGQTITFTTGSGYYGRGKQGDAMFTTLTDYEKRQISSFQLKVDWLRHATSINMRAEEVMGLRDEISSQDNVELGKWLGRKKSDQLFATFQLLLPSNNILYASSKTRDTLLSADTLDWNEIVRMGTTLQPLGGKPANIVRSGAKSAPIFSNIVIGTVPALSSLKIDTPYLTLRAQAETRGAENTIFKGGYANVDGHVIKEYNPLDHDGVGAVGSFLNPRAFLADPVVAGTAAFNITGGGADNLSNTRTDIDFFQYFDGFAYPFLENVGGSAFTPASITRYVIIYNKTGADAGKWGFYSYTTGNDGQRIAVAGRLGSAASGIRATTLGGVTWSGSVHTDAHPTGSVIIAANSKGVPIGSSLMLGASAALRGYGMFRGENMTQKQEGGFITERYIVSVFGQKLYTDRAGRVPSCIRLDHAVSYPDLNLPVVTS
jgi:hypothetical protein